MRLVVWSLATGPIPGATRVYDNRATAGFDLDVAEPQPISGGSINVRN